MNDRGMIKWEPFNSVVPSSIIINKVLRQKDQIEKPILSEEQLKEIEGKLLEYYNTKLPISLDYYESGYIKNINDLIKKIDYITKKVYLNTRTIYFNQIISIN